MNVPKIRFSEFTDEWDYVSLNTFVERVKTKNINNESNLVLTISAQYGLVDQREFFNRNVSSSNLTGYYLLNNGDFAYNKSYSNGYPWGAIKRLNKYDMGVVSSLYICFNCKNNINPLFLEQYFETNKWYQQISEVSVEGARNHGLLNISVEDFFNTEHYIPTIDEQNKIGQFLTLLDKKIELQSKKIEALKLYKKGLSNYIFSLNIFQKLKFNELFRSFGGTSLEEFVSKEGIYNFISIGNYSTDGKYIDNGQKIILNNKTKEKMLNKNDLAMVLNDKTSSGDIIGSTILIDENDKYIYNQRTQRLICNDKILPEYAWCFLNNPNQRRKVFSYAQGGTQIYVNFSSIEKMNVLLPVDYKKQILISKLLINLDNKTNNEIIKLKKLHELKKGLMQNMFI